MEASLLHKSNPCPGEGHISPSIREVGSSVISPTSGETKPIYGFWGEILLSQIPRTRALDQSPAQSGGPSSQHSKDERSLLPPPKKKKKT